MIFLNTLANAGTPLMWGACGWLLIGNFLIGILEWKMASNRLKMPLSQGLFIVANYASAIFGYLAAWFVKDRVDLVLAGFSGLIAMWLGAFALTLAIESVFFWLQVRREAISRVEFWKVLAVVNLASYAIIFPLSFVLGSTKMWREVRVVRADEIKTAPGWAYYLDSAERAVRRVRLDGSKDEVVARLKRQTDKCYVDPTLDGKEAILMVGDEPFKSLGVGAQAAVLNVSGEWKQDVGQIVTKNSKPDRFGMNTPFGSYRSLAWPPRSDLMISNGFWGVLGLRVRAKGLDRNYALETPFASANWRDLTLTSEGVLLASLSGNVVLVDFRTNRIARLARGSCPSVLIDPQAAPKRKVHWVTYQSWRELKEQSDIPL